MTIQKINSNTQIKTNNVKKGNDEPQDKVILGSTTETPDFLKLKNLTREKSGDTGAVTGETGEQQEIRELKEKIEVMRETSRKSFLMGVLGATGLAFSAAVGSPILRLAFAAGGAIALFKGCQTMYDKVMYDF